jgi:hypothetical protein
MADETNATATPAAPKAKKKAKAKKAVKKVVKKVKKSTGGGGGRTSAFSGKRIIKLVKENPRREGTVGFKSFRLIKSGMTYDQYIKAGGRRQDLAFDIAKKYVRVAK